jgi:protein O-GlcNAc transferase
MQCLNILLLFTLFVISNAISARDLLLQVRSAFQKKKFQKVIHLLDSKTSAQLLSKGNQDVNVFELLELLGQSYDAVQNDKEAAKTYDTLLNFQAKRRISKRSLVGLNGLGLILSRQGMGLRAMDLMKEATDVAPNNPAVWNNYGTTQHKHGALNEAVQSYKKAFELSNHRVKVYGYNFANALMDTGKYKKAISALRKVIKLDKSFAEAHWKLGRCYANEQINNFKRAVSSFRAALRHVKTAIKFNKADVLFELHDAYLGLKEPKHKKAILSLERAVQLEPNNAEYVFALEHLYRYTAHFRGLKKIKYKSSMLLSKELMHKHQRSQLSPMRALTFLDGISMLQLMKGWSNSMLSSNKIIAAVPSPSLVSSPRMLRIGFVSSEWETNSPTMHIMDRLPLLMSIKFKKQLTQSQIYVYALKNSHAKYPDSTSLQSMTNVITRRLNTASHAEAAQIVANDHLDYLIDLNGFTGGSRPEIFGMLNSKSGSVSTVSYLGWPSTIGNTDLIQYAVVDRYVVSVETSALFYSEKLLILPGSFFVGDHDYKMSEYLKDVNINSNKGDVLDHSRMHYRKKIFRNDKTFIYCNFNQLFKLSIDKSNTLSVWSQILRRNPSSIMWLLRHPTVAEPAVLLQMLSAGIISNSSNGNSRIIFSDFVDKQTYLKRSSAADLFLDNHQYSAGATGVDALYSRVPILTIPTKRIVGRMASTQLRAMKMTDMITHSVKSYEDIAVYIGQRKRLVRNFRRALKERVKGNLFDINDFTKNVEHLFQLSKDAKNANYNEVKKHIVVGRGIS